MSEEKVLTLRGKRAVWAPGGGSGPIDPKRLPEGYPYKEQSETVLLAEQTLPFGELNGLMMSYADVDIPFSVDQTYKVVWDGTEYICTAYLHEGAVGIGDSSFNGGPATDDPFSMTTYMEKLMVVAHDDAAEHTFSISEFSETIHPMAPEFLPALTSPNGTKYQLTVADDGTLSAVAVS